MVHCNAPFPLCCRPLLSGGLFVTETVWSSGTRGWWDWVPNATQNLNLIHAPILLLLLQQQMERRRPRIRHRAHHKMRKSYSNDMSHLEVPRRLPVNCGSPNTQCRLARITVNNRCRFTEYLRVQAAFCRGHSFDTTRTSTASQAPKYLL
jgi:hypothetical protein